MSTEVTKADLWDLRDWLNEQLRDGFRGVYERQDKTNGRVLAVELDIREHGTKVKNLEREVFPTAAGRRRGSREDDDIKVDPEDRKITNRDVKLVLGTLAVAGALAKAIPFILKAVTP